MKFAPLLLLAGVVMPFVYTMATLAIYQTVFAGTFFFGILNGIFLVIISIAFKIVIEDEEKNE